MILETTWQGIRDQVNTANPDLFQVIDNIQPSESLPLYKFFLPYGQYLVDGGILQLPAHNNISTSKLEKQLGYAPIPTMLLLNKACETFLESPHRTIPLTLSRPGELVGLSEFSDALTGQPTPPRWSLSAGARTIFMLPKITDVQSHLKLKREFNISTHPPKSLWRHFHTFKEITERHREDYPWDCEVLVFTRDWFENIANNPAWTELRKYLLTKSWKMATCSRSRSYRNFIAERLTSAIYERNLKPRFYTIDTAKHLLSISLGMMTGFRPAEDQTIAPVQCLEDAYTNIYGLKEYLPTIMLTYSIYDQPRVLPCYYSLALPTLVEGSPRAKYPPKVMQELRDIKNLLGVFKETVHSMPGFCYDAMKNLQFEFFHTDNDSLSDIHHAKQMPQDDPLLLQTLHSYQDRRFSSTGPFNRGCIRISST